MGEETASEFPEIESRIVGVYNVCFDEELTTADIEFYDLEDDEYEGEIYLPHIGLNVDLWRQWSTEKRIEVLLHEFAHTENYEDDHHPNFWERVVDLTETVIDHQSHIETVFEADVDPGLLKRTVVDSIHEYVIEQDIDTVEARKSAVREGLDIDVGTASSD